MIIRTATAVASMCAAASLAACGGGSGSSAATATGLPDPAATGASASAATTMATPTTGTAPALTAATAATQGGTLWFVGVDGPGTVVCHEPGQTSLFNPMLFSDPSRMTCQPASAAGSYSCTMAGQTEQVTVTETTETANRASAQVTVRGATQPLQAIGSGMPCPSGWGPGDYAGAESGETVMNLSGGASRQAPRPPELQAAMQAAMAVARAAGEG